MRSITLSDAVQLKFGKFKAPVGLELLQQDANTLFAERSLATNLVPNRDLGTQVGGVLFDKVLTYQVGIFNGVADAANPTTNQDFDNDKDLDARLIVQPWDQRAGTSVLSGIRRRHRRQWTAGRKGTSGVTADIQDGRPADVLQIQRRGRGRRPDLAGVPSGVLVRRPLRIAGRIRGIDGERAPDRHRRKRRTAQQSLERRGELGAHGRELHLHRRHSQPAVQLAEWHLGRMANCRPLLRAANRRAGPFRSWPLRDPMPQGDAAWGAGVNWYLNPVVRIDLDGFLDHFENPVNPSTTQILRQDERSLVTRVQLSSSKPACHENHSDSALLAAGAKLLPLRRLRAPQRLLRPDGRELYADYNRAFAQYWKAKTGEDVTVKQSHGGSGAQARSVIDGLQADVVTLALAADIDNLHVHGNLLPADWQKAFPNDSTPYTSTIVILVRKGNPKGIKDWDDLVKPGVKVVAPNPKTSGGARAGPTWPPGVRLNFERRTARTPDNQVRERTLSACQPVLDAAAPAAPPSLSPSAGSGTPCSPGKTRRSSPSESLRDQGLEIGADPLDQHSRPTPPVAVVTAVAEKHGTAALAHAYRLEHLYSDEGQGRLRVAIYYRPRNSRVAAKFSAIFPPLCKLFTIDQVFGGWTSAQKNPFL